VSVEIYSYSVTDSFPNGAVDPSKLQAQIRESSIVTALDQINVNADICDIWFKGELSSTDKNVLDGTTDPDPNPAHPCPIGSIIGDHDGVPLKNSAPLWVKIAENNLLDPDVALSATDGHHVVVKGGQEVSDHSISYPYEIDVLAARYFIPTSMAEVSDGDRFHIIGIPGGDPFVGYVTQDTSQGSTILPVSETTFDYLRNGLDFKLGSHGKIYQIESASPSGGTLTLFEGLEQSVNVGDLIFVRRFICRNVRPSKGVVVTIGDLNPGSAGLCPNAQMVVRYIPEVVPAEDFTLSFEMIYSY